MFSRAFHCVVLIAISAAQLIRTKRGLAESTSWGQYICSDLDSAQLAWHYSWNVVPGNISCGMLKNSTTGTAFVAMAWGAGSVPVTGLFNNAVALLGFNEPNIVSQSNMTPAAAAALWPSLQVTSQQRGLLLGSPAVVSCTSASCIYVSVHGWGISRSCTGIRHFPLFSGCDSMA